MIVKDEEAVIERCLKSCLGFVSALCIYDTGSTDNTIEVIENFAEYNKLKCNVFRSEWRDFSHNRNECLQKASSLYPDSWLFVMDADDSLEHETGGSAPLTPRGLCPLTGTCSSIAPVPPAWEGHASSDPACQGRMVAIEHGKTSFQRIQLISSNYAGTPQGFYYKGVVHECLISPPNAKIIKADGLKLIARCEGARSKSLTKYSDDAAMLLAHYKNNPECTRTVFYLAQSYRDSGELDLARKYYHLRVAMKGWEEEVYVSLMNLIKLCTNGTEILKYAYQAQNLTSCYDRTEAIYLCMRWWRLNASPKDYPIELGYLGLGVALTGQVKDRGQRPLHLFEEDNSWHLYDEVTVISYYVGNKLPKPNVVWSNGLLCAQAALAAFNKSGTWEGHDSPTNDRLQKNLDYFVS
jgi:glycosyltransferase involved in cell wall biosynthesis